MVTGRECCGNGVTHQDGAHRQSTPEGLRQRVHVGNDTRGLGRKECPRAPKTTLHFVEDQRAAARIAAFAQERQKFGRDGTYAPFALHGLDDDGRRALGSDGALCRVAIAQRDDLHAGQERLEWAPIIRSIGRRERREQAPVKRAAERDDVGLLRPLAGELEGALVCLGTRITEECLTGERFRQLRGKPFTRLGAIEIRDVDES